MRDETRPTTAKTWHVEAGLGLVIDGVTFPWHVAADPQAMVESFGMDEHTHILWLPLLIEGPLPDYGRPDGNPVPTALTTPADQSDAAAGGS